MKGLFRRLEDIFVAVTFAEHGEFDEARKVMTQEDAVPVTKEKEGVKEEPSVALRAKA